MRVQSKERVTNPGMRQLGKLVGQVMHELGTVDRFLDDPITRQSGCGGEFLADGKMVRRMFDRARELVREAGWDTYEDFLDEVERRTSGKWVYESGLKMVCDEQEGDWG